MTKIPSVLVLLFVFPIISDCSLSSLVSRFWNSSPDLYYPDLDYLFNETLWTSFKAKHDRWYHPGTEDRGKRTIFEKNLMLIMGHNAGASNETYKLGINQFTDMTPDEFKHRVGKGWRLPADTSSIPVVEFNQFPTPTKRPKRMLFSSKRVEIEVPRLIPKRLDWRQYGVVSLPKDQGDCGNCWAHASAGAIEGVNAISRRYMVQASIQQLVDCVSSPHYISDGCRGGAAEEAMEWTLNNGGITSYASYPLTRDGDSRWCKWTKSVMQISAFGRVTSERDMVYALQYGPLVAAINTGTYALQYYEDGVISGGCGTHPEHAVLIVGYDESSWIVKNSWGTDWGENGFFRLKRGWNMCGISTHVIMAMV